MAESEVQILANKKGKEIIKRTAGLIHGSFRRAEYPDGIGGYSRRITCVSVDLSDNRQLSRVDYPNGHSEYSITGLEDEYGKFNVRLTGAGVIEKEEEVLFVGPISDEGFVNGLRIKRRDEESEVILHQFMFSGSTKLDDESLRIRQAAEKSKEWLRSKKKATPLRTVLVPKDA